MDEKNEILAVGITEAARRLGICARTVASFLARGDLPSRRLGRRRVIRVVDLEAFLRHDHPRTKNED